MDLFYRFKCFEFSCCDVIFNGNNDYFRINDFIIWKFSNDKIKFFYL